MSLVSIAELRAKVPSDLDDTQLQSIIDNEESELVRRFGPHGDGTTAITEGPKPGGERNVYVSRPIVSISSITEAVYLGDTPETVDSTTYYAWKDEGRIERLPSGSQTWGRAVTVTYVPSDDRALRKQVIIELCRLALSQTTLKSESIAGEYSYTTLADDSSGGWEATRARQYRRLGYWEV